MADVKHKIINGRVIEIYNDGRQIDVGAATEEEIKQYNALLQQKASNNQKPKVNVDPTDPKKRQEFIDSHPSKVVTPEEYAELDALYTRAEAASKAVGGKWNKETEEFQQAYHKILDDEAARILSDDKDRTNKGKADKLTQYDLKSNEDGYFGRRTQQYKQALDRRKSEVVKPKAKRVEATWNPDAEEIDATPKATHVDESKLTPANQNAPWWLQDIIKTGQAAGNLARVKAFYPWQATANVVTPDATFYDPTRELAANAEMANIGTQGLASFANPQAFNAGFSQIQGQGFKQAADTLGKYNNLNVGISNQQESTNAGIMNEASQRRAEQQTGLWDKYQAVNQNFQNAKSEARNALVNQYTNAITNRANTQSLNELYPNYAIDPNKGGMMRFHDPRSLKPAKDSEKTLLEYWAEAKQHPGMDDKTAWDYAKTMKGMKSPNSEIQEFQDWKDKVGLQNAYPSNQQGQ